MDNLESVVSNQKTAYAEKLAAKEESNRFRPTGSELNGQPTYILKGDRSRTLYTKRDVTLDMSVMTFWNIVK